RRDGADLGIDRKAIEVHARSKRRRDDEEVERVLVRRQKDVFVSPLLDWRDVQEARVAARKTTRDRDPGRFLADWKVGHEDRLLRVQDEVRCGVDRDVVALMRERKGVPWRGKGGLHRYGFRTDRDHTVQLHFIEGTVVTTCGDDGSAAVRHSSEHVA